MFDEPKGLNGTVALSTSVAADTMPVTVGAVDNHISAVTQATLTERARDWSKTTLKREARQLLSDRLKTDRSGISLRELDDASDDTRSKALKIAQGVVKDLVARGHTSPARLISDDEARQLLNYLMATQFGAGELEPLFHDPDVEDILINSIPVGRRSTQIEVLTYRQSGKRKEKIEIGESEVIELVNRAARWQGRQLTPVTPILNAQMPNSARINASMEPACHRGVSVTIRIHRLIARTFDDLIRLGTLTEPAAAFLTLCAQAKLAVCVAGGTSTGKTNFLNAFSGLIHPRERIVCIEDTHELDIAVPDKVYLVTVDSQDGSRVITPRQLVANALRMRPDRIILGEARGGEAYDAIKATNTGHDGSLLTVHAEDAESVAKRLTQLCREAPETHGIPDDSLREQIARAFQIVVFIERHYLPDGSSKRIVTQINELSGLVQNELISQTRLFQLNERGLEWTRAHPHDRIKKRFHEAGISDKDVMDALAGRSKPWQRLRGGAPSS